MNAAAMNTKAGAYIFKSAKSILLFSAEHSYQISRSGLSENHSAAAVTTARDSEDHESVSPAENENQDARDERSDERANCSSGLVQVPAFCPC